MKMALNLTNCVVYIRFESKNYKNAQMRIVPEYKNKVLERIFVKKSMFLLEKEESVKKLHTFLNDEYDFEFTESDCEIIYEHGCNLMMHADNVAEEMTFDEAVRELYNYHLRNCKENLIDVKAGIKELTYIRTNNGIDYFCICSSALQDALDMIGAGMKALKFKRTADAVVELWVNGGAAHRMEYQNVVAGEKWSVRIPMNTKYFEQKKEEVA